MCIEAKWVPVAMLATGEATAGKDIDIGICQERYQGSILAINAQGALNAAHILSAGAVSFARGLTAARRIYIMIRTAARRGHGQAAMQTFLDSVPMAKEKVLAARAA